MSSTVTIAAEDNYITHCPLRILNTHDAAQGDSTFWLQVKEILLQLRTFMSPLHQVNLYAQKTVFLMLWQKKLIIFNTTNKCCTLNWHYVSTSEVHIQASSIKHTKTIAYFCIKLWI